MITLKVRFESDGELIFEGSFPVPEGPGSLAFDVDGDETPQKPVIPKKPTAARAARATSTRKRGRVPQDPAKLRKPQVRLLEALFIADRPLTRFQLTADGDIDKSTFTSYVGSMNLEKREANDIKYYPSLLSRKFIRAIPSEVGDRITFTYALTTAGEEALE